MLNSFKTWHTKILIRIAFLYPAGFEMFVASSFLCLNLNLYMWSSLPGVSLFSKLDGKLRLSSVIVLNCPWFNPFCFLFLLRDISVRRVLLQCQPGGASQVPRIQCLTLDSRPIQSISLIPFQSLHTGQGKVAPWDRLGSWLLPARREWHCSLWKGKSTS